MNHLNSSLIEGNLVRDPEFKTTPNGTPVCKLSIATNRWYKGSSETLEKETSFFDIEAWAKVAEACHEKGKKGRGVRVVGRLKQDRWNAPDGKQHSKVVIVAEHVEFRPEFKKDGTGDQPSGENVDF